MQLRSLKHLFGLNSEERSKYFSKLIHNKRNQTLRIFRDYYDGNHWNIGIDGRSNETKSGKYIWGKRNTFIDQKDEYQRDQNRGRDISFTTGQLQTKNYIKRFIDIYQDNVNGNENTDIRIVFSSDVEAEEVEEANETINEDINYLWLDIEEFTKQQIASMVLNTVFVSSLRYNMKSGEYYVQMEDPIEIFPIYDNKKFVGTIKAYDIQGDEASLYTRKKYKDNQKVSYAEIYFPNESGNYQYVRYVDGLVTTDSGEIELLPEETNFNPFSITPNLDHPFHNFDDNELEASEITSWIENNDTLNAISTIEYLTNLFLASPKVGVDLEVLDKMGMSITDEEVKAALEKFQFNPFSIDTMPIKVYEGNSIPQSFYTGMTIRESELYQDAGVPKFLVGGDIPSGIAVETIELGMQSLSRKIDQKREQLKKQIKDLTVKMLKAKNYISKEEKLQTLNIDIELPPVISMSTEKIINLLNESAKAGIMNNRYVRDETLMLLNRGGDVNKIREIEAEDFSGLTDEIRKRKEATQNTLLVERQEQEKLEKQRRLEELEQQLNE